MSTAIQDVTFSEIDARKLLACDNGDAALLLLFLRCGNHIDRSEDLLGWSTQRISTAADALRSLGLLRESQIPRRPPCEPEALRVNQKSDEITLIDEIQLDQHRLLTRSETKALREMILQLGLPAEVLSILYADCKRRCEQKQPGKQPSIQMLEKEALAWADRNINTLEEAVAYTRRREKESDLERQLQEAMGIDRPFVPREKALIQNWSGMGFDLPAILLAYERTCFNTGGLKWAYMNRILENWDRQGLHTVDVIQNGDTVPTGKKCEPAPRQWRQNGPRELDAEEIAAIRALMESDESVIE